MLGFRASIVALAFSVVLGSSGGYAVEVVDARLDANRIDLTEYFDLYQTEGDHVVVPTAPAPDGIVRFMEVRARENGTHWAVVALTNNSDDQIERLLVAPRYKLVSVGLLLPASAQSNIELAPEICTGR